MFINGVYTLTEMSRNLNFLLILTFEKLGGSKGWHGARGAYMQPM
jgi:hypothetical protein